MSKFTGIIVAISLAFGIASTSHAVNLKSDFESKSNQPIESYGSLVSTKSMMKYTETLLLQSSVAHKLKSSNDVTDHARYERAMDIYEKATKAYLVGDNTQAKNLALESIRLIAKSVSQYNNRVAKLNN